MSFLPTTIFLDRDGVINKKLPDGNYVKNWKEFRFLPGALEGIRALNEVCRHLIVVTNQRGIALGVMTEQDLDEIHANMITAVREAGGKIDAIYYCPHDRGVCACRKPGTGLFEQAKRSFADIEYERSLVVGDSLVDLQAASRLGCSSVLITSRTQWPNLLEQVRREGLAQPRLASSLAELSRELRGGSF